MLLLLCNTTLLFAQSNYKSGYIVKTPGDTTRGFINYREWEQSPFKISFKSVASDKAENFTVADIRAFGIDDAEYFERYTLKISQDDANPTTAANKSIDTTYKTDVVFAKVITKGKYLNLYSYTDELKTRFYLSTPSWQTPRELGYHIKPIVGQGVSGDGNYSYATLEPYKQQLTLVAQNSNALNSNLAFKIEHLQYNERELRAVAQKINGSNTGFTTKALPGSRFFIGAGVSMGKFKFNGEGTFPANLHIKNTSPAAFAGLDLFLNKYTQKFYFRTQLEYFSHHYGYQDVVSKTNPNITSTLSFKQSTVSFSLLPSFNFYNKPGFKAFINAGGGVGLSSYNKYKYIENFYQTSQREQDNYPEFSRTWVSAQANIGVEISGRASVTAGCSTYSRITNYTGITASVAWYHVGLMYIFGKP